MPHGEKRYILILCLFSVIILLASIAWFPKFADSETPEEICPKHNVSTGEYTACLFCHNAESPTDSGFTINSDSKFCLSCHDGTTMDTLSFTTLGSATERITTPVSTVHMKGIDHPVSVSYTDAKNRFPTLKLRSQPTSETVKLFDDTVECASCHDPHSCKNPLFLRIKNDRSALCIACHEM